jgi:hypothetical protein
MASDPFAERPATRAAFLRSAAGALAAVGVLPDLGAAATRSPAPLLGDVGVTADGEGFDGDHRTLVTLKPEGARFGRAFVHFRLAAPADVTLQALQTGTFDDVEVWRAEARLPAGRHKFTWLPDPALPARTYLLRLTSEDVGGRTAVYGGRPPRRRHKAGPVVRLLGVEACFAARSYAPRSIATLNIAASARSLAIDFFRNGPEEVSSYINDELSGVQVAGPITLDWAGKDDRMRQVRIALGDWPTGLYYARLVADDGRIGHAPFVVRPATLGLNRVAAVLPTNTWQAYNFRDADCDGWGDTWYAGGSPPVLLNRPFLDRGVPPRFKQHDRAFIRWAALTGRGIDFLADDDLERIASGDALHTLYDLVVFPGHSEYMTRRAYDVVTRYRDLGGNLVFLSANNFFWQVRKKRAVMRRDILWRDIGRPEAGLIGTQYKANDEGHIQRPFVVRNAAAAPWLWAGTGLFDGATFGEQVGGFGTEIDATTESSPPGTIVVAEIPDVFGPGRTAQMTYYETPAGARVFAAGVLDFGGSILFQPMRQLLENVWARLATP